MVGYKSELEPLEFQIEATPSGYQIKTYRGAIPSTTHRTTTLLGAKYWIWAYKRRIKKANNIKE